MFGKTAKNTSRRQLIKDAPANTTFSYYANRSNGDRAGERRLDRQTAKRLQGPRWWHHLPSLAAIVAIGLSLIYILGLDTNPRVIQPSKTETQFLRTKATYQQAAHKLFNRSVLNHNKITVNTDGIARDLKKQFPELTNVSITLPLVGRRPLIYIQPGAAVLIINSQGHNYVLDKTGKAIIAPGDVNKVTDLKLPMVEDKSGLQVKLGQGVLPGDDVTFISFVNEQLKTQKIAVASLTLPAVANQLDVRIVGKRYVIKMNLQQDAKQQIGAFLAAKQKLEADHLEPSEYFDTRVEERIYYK